MSQDIVIVAAARTAVGKFNGIALPKYPRLNSAAARHVKALLRAGPT